MEMQASRQLSVTQQQAWDALNDPEVLKLCIPGCTSIESTGENQYAIALSLKIGPVSAKFNGVIMLTNMQPPASYTLSFEGKGGAAGFGKGTAQVRLEPNDNGCELHYTVHATVGGKIAQMGQRLIDGTAKSMADDFFKRFDEEMQRRHAPADDTVGGDNDTTSTAGNTQASAGTGEAATTTGRPSSAANPGSPPASKPTGTPMWVWAAVAAAVVVAAVAMGNA